MADNSKWFSKPSGPPVGGPMTLSGDVLELMRRATSQMSPQQVQQQSHQLALDADAQGLEQTLGPLGLAPSVGAMGFAMAGAPLAVGVGQDLGRGVKDLMQSGSPKALGLSLMSLPLLIGMAAANKSSAAKMTDAELAAGWNRIIGNKKAAKIFEEMDANVDPEPMLRYLQNIPDEQLVPALTNWASSRTKDLLRKEQGRDLVAGPRVQQSLSDETTGGHRIAAPKVEASPLQIDAKITEPAMWAKVDLTNSTGTAQRFREFMVGEMHAASTRPEAKVKEINRAVANTLMEQGLKVYNNWAKAEAARIAKAGSNEEIPKTMTANFKLRERYAGMLDDYFLSKLPPTRVKESHIGRELSDYRAATPELNKRLADVSAKGIPIYKTSIVKQDAVKKFFTGHLKDMSNEELNALLDIGVNTSASRIISLAESLRQAKLPKSK